MIEILIMVFTLCIVFFLCRVVFAKQQKYEFMSFQHSSIYRGTAALIIMLQHFAGAYNIRYLTPLGGIGVAMFLISSGFGLNESYKKNLGNGYWKNKFLKVFIPYAALEIILAPLHKGITVSSLLLDITCIKPEYWYLQYILFSYITFYLIIKIPEFHKYKYLVLGVYAISSFFWGSDLQAEQALSFIIGIVISDNKEVIKGIFNNATILLILTSISMGFLVIKQLPIIRVYEGMEIYYLVQLLIKLPMALILISITYKARMLFNNKYLQFMGGISYEFYLLHVALLILLGVTQVGYFSILLFLISSIFSAYIYNFIFTKIDNQLKNNNETTIGIRGEKCQRKKSVL